MIAGNTFAEMREGDRAQFEVSVDDALVQKFADLSGDMNPLHMDAEFAKSTPIGGRVAHGMLGGALFSRLVGMHLPGKHCLYLSQSLFFRKPMRIPATVTVSGTVIQKIEALQALKIATVIADAKTGDILTDGEAMVKVLV
jgi:acyl dehydratase